MKKTAIFLLACVAVAACDKHDPILPGERTSIFNTSDLNMLNTDVPEPGTVEVAETSDCPYRQDESNTIWDGERKIFYGFATGNSVEGKKKPVCKNNMLYAGLSTGELIKINPKNKRILWIADIFRPSNMTGGASVLDIVAPIVPVKNYVYAGGLGGAFCKVSDTTGNKQWCTDINVDKPFIITTTTAYVLDTDKNLYAIRLKDGAVYWRTQTDKDRVPEYDDGVITVGREKFDAKTGKIID